MNPGDLTETRLVIDRGNSQTKCAIFRGGEMLVREVTGDEQLETVIASLRQSWEPVKAIVASVRDMPAALNQSLEGINWVQAHSGMPLPITVNYETPETLGIDRLADAVAAYRLSGGQHALAIDCGTCITYNVVAGGSFTGGAISPGLDMRFRALNEHTARLPLLSGRAFPDAAGTSTRDSILQGVLGGAVFEMEGMIDRFCSKYAIQNVYLTGGDVSFFAGALKRSIFADPYLTLKGLNEILS